jgi:hypothetical protein
MRCPESFCERTYLAYLRSIARKERT